jgi:hypothetical protein
VGMDLCVSVVDYCFDDLFFLGRNAWLLTLAAESSASLTILYEVLMSDAEQWPLRLACLGAV